MTFLEAYAFPEQQNRKQYGEGTLSLSMGATLETSPSCNALKINSHESPVATAGKKQEQQRAWGDVAHPRTAPDIKAIPHTRTSDEASPARPYQIGIDAFHSHFENRAVRDANTAESNA